MKINLGYLYPKSPLNLKPLLCTTCIHVLLSIAYLLNESEHIYWVLDLEGEVHSICDLWISGLQECKGNNFFKVGRADISFWLGLENMDLSLGAYPWPNLPP